MNEITVSAKTLDDAITEASIQLGVASDQMEYDVIEKGSAGFLGIGSRQAVIRARIKKTVTEEIKAEEIKPEEIKKEFKKDFRKDRKEFVGHKERKEYKEYKKDSKKDFKKEPKKEFVKENKTETASAVTAAAPVYEEKKELHVAVVTEATQKICEKFLQEVLQAMGMGEVTIVSSIDEEGALAIEMSGDNMGILIGKRGQTLDSLQYLTNRVANKSQDGYVRVKLDTEDYRKRRKQTLENLAKNIAYKVKRSRKPISLEPMNPYERRIIHSALQADDRVSTHSEGEEPYRRVVVTPNRR
ncbi:protein jag [Coprococcus comes]|uniref:RNA-binding protein KhpB n=1 Tax=Coprococcus comes TaxID=410072 RepID=A0A3R6DHD5_9FIRM|nr:RNA-binding cell elongation regulator Jag/EloR [Coprococcus comes]RGT87449.1 protein jag [Coprococcus comes]